MKLSELNPGDTFSIPGRIEGPGCYPNKFKRYGDAKNGKVIVRVFTGKKYESYPNLSAELEIKAT